MSESKREIKKKYSKPELRVICIAPGTQTLAEGCKMINNGNPAEFLPEPCGLSASCSQVGS